MTWRRRRGWWSSGGGWCWSWRRRRGRSGERTSIDKGEKEE